MKKQEKPISQNYKVIHVPAADNAVSNVIIVQGDNSIMLEGIDVTDLADLIDPKIRIKAVTTQQEWINVKDRLPEERVFSCLVYNGDAPECNRHVFEATWFSQFQRFVFEDKQRPFLGSITHYIPKPEPPTNTKLN